MVEKNTVLERVISPLETLKESLKGAESKIVQKWVVGCSKLDEVGQNRTSIKKMDLEK